MSAQARFVTRPDHYPNITQAIGLLLVAVFLMIAAGIGAGIVLGLLAGMLRIPVRDLSATTAAVELLAIGLTLLWGFRRTRASFEEVFPLAPFRPGLIAPIVLAVVGCAILLSEADNALRLILPMPARYADIFSRIAGGGTSVWGSLAALVVVAPLTEEFLFRGLILRGFLNCYGARKAILASALLFGAFHLNPWQFLPAVVVGVLFGWWFAQTRSLVPGIAGHALFNGVPWAMQRVVHLNIPGFTAAYWGVEFQPLWFALSGLLLTGLGLVLVRRMFRFGVTSREAGGNAAAASKSAPPARRPDPS